MSYPELSDEEVQEKLRNHNEADWTERTGNEVIEPRDVFYYLNAFGDLTMAINLQGVPKDLPDKVLQEAGQHDLLAEWHGEIEEHECPTCGRTLYEFEASPCSIIIDEYGDTHGDEIQLLSDPASFKWDTTGEHRFMCTACIYDNPFDRFGSQWGVKIFYGDDDWYHFRHTSGVVSHDAMGSDDRSCYPKNLRNNDGEIVKMREIETVFASNDTDRLTYFMEQMGFTEITPKDVSVTTPSVRKAKRYAEEILSGWAEAPHQDVREETTHPDFDFVHMIEDGKHFFCHEDDRDEVIYHLNDQVLFEAGATEQLKEHRENAI